jgi:UDP-N-acetylmuramoyl-tripeptide--D-alanyl-D-alanine ligase
MLELGPAAQEHHAQLGRRIGQSRIDLLVTIGPMAKVMAGQAIEAGLPAPNVHSYDTADQAADAAERWLEGDDVVLVKASRGIRAERVAERITQMACTDDQAASRNGLTS